MQIVVIRLTVKIITVGPEAESVTKPYFALKEGN